MSKSNRWKMEWSFFLGRNGRRQYNKVCKRCAHSCKQSFRAALIQCPKYQSKAAKNTPEKG